ncbi:MAG: hypothetical protein LBP69_03780, partial [Treponema sp.]|nr:hypothetical protein [Treponema sp.]
GQIYPWAGGGDIIHGGRKDDGEYYEREQFPYQADGIYANLRRFLEHFSIRQSSIHNTPYPVHHSTLHTPPFFVKGYVPGQRHLLFKGWNLPKP